MINSLKQMARTPVRTVLFLILMFFAALLLTLGTCIWLKGNSTMAQYEDRFMTIGTVRQIPDSFEQTLQWNAETKDYDVRKNAQYRSYYTPEDMLFPEAEYIAGPEQRAFYTSYGPEYLMYNVSVNPSALSMGSLIAEFSPTEDCTDTQGQPGQRARQHVPAHPVGAKEMGQGGGQVFPGEIRHPRRPGGQPSGQGDGQEDRTGQAQQEDGAFSAVFHPLAAPLLMRGSTTP